MVIIKLNSYTQKNETRILYYTQNSSKWIKDLKGRRETSQILEEHIGSKLLNSSLDKEVFESDSKK